MDDIRKGSCPLCSHHEIVMTTPREIADDSSLRPIHAHAHVKGTLVATTERYGRLSAYVCRACGYTQWFASNPEDIPIGEGHATRLIKGATPAGPHR